MATEWSAPGPGARLRNGVVRYSAHCSAHGWPRRHPAFGAGTSPSVAGSDTEPSPPQRPDRRPSFSTTTDRSRSYGPRFFRGRHRSGRQGPRKSSIAWCKKAYPEESPRDWPRAPTSFPSALAMSSPSSRWTSTSWPAKPRRARPRRRYRSCNWPSTKPSSCGRRDGSLSSAALALLATAILGLLLWAAGRLHRKMVVLLPRGAERRLQRMSAGDALVKASRAPDVLRHAVTAVFVGLSLFLAYSWLTFVLRRFPYTRPWGESLRAFLLDRITFVGLKIVGRNTRSVHRPPDPADHPVRRQAVSTRCSSRWRKAA